MSQMKQLGAIPALTRTLMNGVRHFDGKERPPKETLG